jgi:hypothetical protein
MVLKLDPAIPLVWRSPSAVQFGIDVAVAIVEPVSSGQERLLAALATGVSRSGYDMLARQARVAPADAEALLAAVGPVLRDPAADPVPRVAVLGATPLADEIRELLGADGSSDPETAQLVVLCADWVLTPSDHGAWLSRDRPHLPVIRGDRGTTIGPFVEPDSGPCLYCVHLAHVDADPAYPAIVSQLWGRAAPELERLALVEAATVTVRRIRAWRPPSATAVSWRVEAATGRVTPTEWRRHPGCLCAAPSESDWVPGSDPVSPDAPTTSAVGDAPG